ncbi:MAG TPA: DUF190 domain-containing protein [Gelidibacter sp.]|uniref:DUF190 domain-containing protein n=1 Tax=Gelidibacter sp. TaxID=2018083 RepID=UPI002BD100BD|nr:DUF190 domain-containing protein [Gelidibacter sp.]HXJ98453.1 DUF190 domain-containing protein [Gelidibacter sp.]
MLQAQVFIDKDELKGVKPLHQFIMKLLIENGIAGATSVMGYSGFGKHNRLKQPSQLFSFDEASMYITFIDTEDKVKSALSNLRAQYRGGFIVTHKVSVW